MDARDDLTPGDGLCNVFIEFDGMQTRLGSPHGDFTFRFVQRQEGAPDRVVATMSFPVNAKDDGHPGMMVRAYDQLILVLRQNLFLAGRARNFYRSEVARLYPRDPYRR